MPPRTDSTIARPSVSDHDTLPATMSGRETPKVEKRTLAITATFTSEPIAASLGFWNRQSGTDWTIEFAPYDQIFQQLVDPQSLLGRNRHGANMLLVCPEDWLGNRTEIAFDPATVGQHIEKIADEFLDALRAAAARTPVPHIVALCPHNRRSAQPAAMHAILDKITGRLMRELPQVPGVVAFSPDELTELYPTPEFHDIHGNDVGHVRYSPAGFTALGTLLYRKLDLLGRPRPKVIVLDCDNTLWSGVCGEDGPRGVRLEEARRALQTFMLKQREAGLLLCLCSKNNEADALAVFAQRPEMPLRLEHFAAHRLNWTPKSENLRSLAQELNLGLDSFVFVDDNPAECAEVAAACPEVLVLPLPAELAGIEPFLRQVWAFDLTRVTDEDRKRNAMMSESRARESFQKSSPTFADFLAGLNLQIEIRAPAESEWGRAAQLTERTNQFNSSSLRCTEQDLRRAGSDGSSQLRVVHVKDRFGEYGLVGLLRWKHDGETLVADQFLLSCRVLGKGVEHRMLAQLGAEASSQGKSRVAVLFNPTERNEPARNFLQQAGPAERTSGSFIFPTQAAIAMKVTSGAPAPTPASENTGQKKTAGSSARRRTDYAAIARSLATVDDIQRAIRRRNLKPRSALLNAPVAPRDGTEERVIAIWEEVLSIAPLGIRDSFLELGGQSIQAVQILSRIAAEFSARLPLSALFQHPTVAGLSEMVTQTARQDGSGIPATTDLVLSAAQERMWFLDQFIQQRSAYNIVAARHIRGPFDVRAWENAILHVVQTHEPLRTIVRNEQGSRQPHVENISLPPVRKITAMDEKTALRALEEDAISPFDLTRAPLLRSLVVSLAPDRHYCQINVHHIAADGWSLNLLLREIATAYEAAAAHHPIPPIALPARYSDYATWFNQRLASNKFASDIAYWRTKLAAAPRLLELPGDFPRPPVMAYRGGACNASLSSKQRAAIERFASAAATTPFVVLLSVFQALLQRYSGQGDILVGTPVAGRTHPSVEKLCGCFINTVVVRNQVDRSVPFANHVSAVGATVWEAIAHSELPFERLVDELQTARDVSHGPLCQVMLVLQNAPEGDFIARGLTVESAPVHNGGAKFDLLLEITPQAHGFGLVLEYNSSLFRHETAARMLGHFTTMLDHAIVHPDRPLGELPLLTPPEEQQFIAWNNTAVSYPTEKLLHHLFEAQAARTPDATALVFGENRLTYHELDERANQLANHLLSLGVEAGRFVGVYTERSIEMVVALYGILKAGCAYVPIDPEYPRDRVAYMLEDADAPVLLTQQHLTASLPPHRGLVVCLDRDWPQIAQAGSDRPSDRIKPHDLAYMIYTSGSTGRPKGAMNAHRGIVNRLLWMQDEYQLMSQDVVLQKTPFSFDVSVWEFFWPLFTGASLVIARPGGHRDPLYLVSLIQDKNVTVLHFVPSMLRVFAETAGVDQCRSLRAVICSGEALPPDLVDAMHARSQAAIHNLYGPTEAAVDVTYWACPRQTPTTVVPIGRPVANTQCYVLDERLQRLPVGVPGELHLGGIQVGRGYHRRPDLTAEKFIADPFIATPEARLYKTGDLCRYLPDGAIEYLGRIDHQVKIRGFRIELGEIEANLAQHTAIKDAVVLAREDTPGDKRLVAYVVARTQPAPTDAELVAHIKLTLPDFMVPSHFVFMPEMPLSPNGKADRKALPKPDAARPRAAASFLPPATEMEKQIAAIWRDVLALPQVGVQDNFFDIGGQSLKLMRVHAQLRAQLQIEVPIVALFQHPTIGALTSFLSKNNNGPQPDAAAAKQVVQDRAQKQREALQRQKALAEARRIR